jgi:hypothetical protein
MAKVDRGDRAETSCPENEARPECYAGEEAGGEDDKSRGAVCQEWTAKSTYPCPVLGYLNKRFQPLQVTLETPPKLTPGLSLH